MNVIEQTHNGTRYILRGDTPKLLILSGTHGDETEVTTCVTRYINSHQDILPDYLYIPDTSPSACALKTRRNNLGNDLNRQFTRNPTDPEVIAISNILKPYSFQLCLAFHEDPDRSTSFYIYDSDVMTQDLLHVYRKHISQTGARLYAGIDDPADKDLSLEIHSGYVSTTIEASTIETGFSMRWLIENNIVKRVFNPEIPGKAKIPLKQALVDAMFSFTLAHCI